MELSRWSYFYLVHPHKTILSNFFHMVITCSQVDSDLIKSLRKNFASALMLQKLDKVKLALQSEKKLYDTTRENYTTAILEQRQSSSFLKLFQVP